MECVSVVIAGPPLRPRSRHTSVTNVFGYRTVFVVLRALRFVCLCPVCYRWRSRAVRCVLRAFARTPLDHLPKYRRRLRVFRRVNCRGGPIVSVCVQIIISFLPFLRRRFPVRCGTRVEQRSPPTVCGGYCRLWCPRRCLPNNT